VADAEAQRDFAGEVADLAPQPIGAVFNNAGVATSSSVLDTVPEDDDWLWNINFHGVVNGTRAFLPILVEQNEGAIVNTSSVFGLVGMPNQSAYCAAKFAVRGFTDSLRSELLHDGSDVRVTMVQMPALNTPQFEWCKTRMPLQPQPVPPIYQPEVAARAIVWAAHHRRREVWVGASTLKAIWANKLAPGLLDRYLAATGYESQESSEPVEANRVDNFYNPVAGDHRAHGRFDARSSESSAALWLTTHRLFATAAAALGMIALGAGMLLRNRSRR
jgi:short-subunit dehydrogenase